MANQKLKTAAYHLITSCAGRDKSRIHILQAIAALPKRDSETRDLITKLSIANDHITDDILKLANRLAETAETDDTGNAK